VKYVAPDGDKQPFDIRYEQEIPLSKEFEIPLPQLGED
jgi:hypothetical protein